MNIKKYLNNYLIKYFCFFILLPVLLSCSSTIQTTILKPVKQTESLDKIISIKEGNLIIKDVSLTKREKGYFFNMSVTNNTNVIWEYLSFKLNLFDENGNQINSYQEGGSTYYNFIPKIYFLHKNETKYLPDNSVYRYYYKDEKLGQDIYGLENNVITSYDITLERSEEYYRPKYLFSLIRPKENKNLVYKDEFVDIIFFGMSHFKVEEKA